MRVFLGGTCTGHNWREQIIPKLHCDYFNPLVENWTEECRLIEEKEKKICDCHLYVINGFMTGVYSIAEVIDDSNKRPERTIFLFKVEDDGKRFNAGQIRSLDKVGRMVERNGGKFMQSFSELILYPT